jgi:hypothetical protein
LRVSRQKIKILAGASVPDPLVLLLRTVDQGVDTG